MRYIIKLSVQNSQTMWLFITATRNSWTSFLRFNAVASPNYSNRRIHFTSLRYMLAKIRRFRPLLKVRFNARSCQQSEMLFDRTVVNWRLKCEIASIWLCVWGLEVGSFPKFAYQLSSKVCVLSKFVRPMDSWLKP